MTDMLVKLYELPQIDLSAVHPVVVRRALAPEKHVVLDWISKHFSAYWVSEVDVAFSQKPLSCFIAVDEGQLCGFACYDVTARGFFGPTGVGQSKRGYGIGKVLLLACLHDMLAQGYGYAIIGGVGPVEFYQRAVNATVIAGSTPGIYAGMLSPQATDDD